FHPPHWIEGSCDARHLARRHEAGYEDDARDEVSDERVLEKLRVCERFSARAINAHRKALNAVRLKPDTTDDARLKPSRSSKDNQRREDVSRSGPLEAAVEDQEKRGG